MDIALFGGRFDPPHVGHLEVARALLRSGMDEVWFIPANTHPWRPIIASAQDRLHMTKFLEGDRIKVSDVDIKRGGKTYTIDTVRKISNLKNQISKTNNTFYWVCGVDQIKNFHRWKDYKHLQEIIQFLVFSRIGYKNMDLPEHFSYIKDNFIANGISSSMIRERIKNDLPISDVVPKKVEKYIKEKGLYK